MDRRQFIISTSAVLASTIAPQTEAFSGAMRNLEAAKKDSSAQYFLHDLDYKWFLEDGLYKPTIFKLREVLDCWHPLSGEAVDRSLTARDVEMIYEDGGLIPVSYQTAKRLGGPLDFQDDGPTNWHGSDMASPPFYIAKTSEDCDPENYIPLKKPDRIIFIETPYRATFLINRWPYLASDKRTLTQCKS